MGSLLRRVGILSVLFVFVAAIATGARLLHPLTTADTVGEMPIAVLIGPTGERLEVHVSIADTPQARERGLMFRAELEEDSGMLFAFPDYARPARLSFWMKNTLIPLDILFFRHDGAMVSWTSMEPCTADPCPVYQSAAPAAYALELPAGFVMAHAIDAQWRLELPHGA